ncbi:hypothetical protein BH23VER1_BH23VER1_02090 [soil metagenome]
MKSSTFALAAAAGMHFIGPSYAAVQLIGPAIYTIDFADFDGAGFSPTPTSGQLDSNMWAVSGLSDGPLDFGESGTSGDFARGTSPGGVTTGGVYAFDVDNVDASVNRALGIQPIGSDFTPGAFTLRLQNSSGAMLTRLEVAYDVLVLNNADRSNSFNFTHSPESTSGFMAVPSLDFTSPEGGDLTPSWTRAGRSISLTGLEIADQDFYYLQWTGDDVGGSGSRDEFALDNITISTVPEPSRPLLVALGLLGILARRRR